MHAYRERLLGAAYKAAAPFSRPAAGGSPPAPRGGRHLKDLARSYNVNMATISRLRT